MEQTRQEVCTLVQRFLNTNLDSKVLLASLIYMDNGEDYDVKKCLHIRQKELERIKAEIAAKLVKTGITPWNSDNTRKTR